MLQAVHTVSSKTRIFRPYVFYSKNVSTLPTVQVRNQTKIFCWFLVNLLATGWNNHEPVYRAPLRIVCFFFFFIRCCYCNDLSLLSAYTLNYLISYTIPSKLLTYNSDLPTGPRCGVSPVFVSFHVRYSCINVYLFIFELSYVINTSSLHVDRIVYVNVIRDTIVMTANGKCKKKKIRSTQHFSMSVYSKCPFKFFLSFL